jgi:outer membrane immunogenic protein
MGMFRPMIACTNTKNLFFWEGAMNAIKVISIVLVMLVSGNCFAGSDSGVYIGASVGQSYIDQESVFDRDDSASAYKAVVGYNFGWIPTVDLAVEGSFRDLGTYSGGDFGMDITTMDLYGVAGFKLAAVGLFGKLGVSRFDSGTEYDGLNIDSNSTNYSYGIGARANLGSVSFRAEYEMFNEQVFKLNDSISMVSVGATYTF